MERGDLVRFALGALAGHRLRSALSALGVAIGVAAVVLLTALGEGTRQYVVGQFTQFGTNLIAVTGGKIKTFGIPGALGGTTAKITIDDAMALAPVPGVSEVVPVAVGQARVEAGDRGRTVYVYGSRRAAARGVARRGVARQLSAADRPRPQGSPWCSGPSWPVSCSAPSRRSGRRVRIGSRSWSSASSSPRDRSSASTSTTSRSSRWPTR